MAPAEYLEEFYAEESERVNLFRQPDASGPAFDIVVLHVCSLSWHDLKEIGLSKDEKFFQQFDYLFSNFNSVTGYSGPAMRRMLQANCGQRSHKEIHDSNTPKECMLFERLASIGYQSSISMNHNGKYDDFIGTVKDSTPKDTALLSPEKLKPQAIFFDGETKLYNDLEVLKQWQDTVKISNPERAALYYNSVLLHAGVRWVGEKTVSGRDPHEQFEDVALTLMDDVQLFIKQLQASNRNTVLVFVPEHGRALVGSSIQLADVRDIPLTSITKVPVGVKLIGPGFNSKGQQEITKPTSYFALSWLISKFITKSPFAEKATEPAKLAAKIPKTEHVSEHEGRIVVEIGEKTLYRGKDGKWVSLRKDQI
jgi:cellulose synthase operon protein YhjU